MLSSWLSSFNRTSSTFSSTPSGSSSSCTVAPSPGDEAGTQDSIAVTDLTNISSGDTDQYAIDRWSLRFACGDTETRFLVFKASASVKVARAVSVACAAISAVMIFATTASFRRVINAAQVILFGAAALGLTYSPWLKRRSEWLIAIVLGAGELFLVLPRIFAGESAGFLTAGATAGEAANGTCITAASCIGDWNPTTLSCYHPFLYHLMRNSGMVALFGIMGSILLGVRFWFSCFAVVLPLSVNAADYVAAGVEYGFLRSSAFVQFLAIIYAPALITSLGLTYRFEHKDRVAFARGERIARLLKHKEQKILKQKKSLSEQKRLVSRLSEQKKILEEKIMPSNEEERLFAPFRARLHEIVGEHFLDGGEFRTLRTLGKGAYGEVRLAEWTHRGFDKPLQVAVKALHPHLIKTNHELTKLSQEIEMLDKLRHTNVVKFMGVSWNQGSFPFIVMEFVPNGTVAELLHGSDSRSATEVTWSDPMTKVAVDMCKGLQYLHQTGIMLVMNENARNLVCAFRFEAGFTSICDAHVGFVVEWGCFIISTACCIT